MMEPVATNEHPREEPPALPPDLVPGPGTAPPPAPRQPTEITPEQVRQFQEFQHFQQLMREAADQGMPPGNPPPGLLQPWGPPPPKQSLPKRLLKAAVSKIITGLVVLAILVVAGYFAVDYFFGEDQNDRPAHETGGQKTTGNFILPDDPYEAVRKIYHQIANGNGVPEQVCLRFDDGGKKFASDMGYDSCKAAVAGLHAQVTNRNAYAESMPPKKSTFNPMTHDEVRISSCQDNVRGGIKGGPALGAFTVKKILDSAPGPGGGKQWIITDHENEPPCATTSTGPTN
jgi:hypothetical protein